MAANTPISVGLLPAFKFSPRITNLSLTLRHGCIIKTSTLSLAAAPSPLTWQQHKQQQQQQCNGSRVTACPPSTTTATISIIPTSTAWLMLGSHVEENTGDKQRHFYCPTDGQMVKVKRKATLHVPQTATCFGSSLGGWLGFINEDGSIYMSNPFNRDIIELSSIGNFP